MFLIGKGYFQIQKHVVHLKKTQCTIKTTFPQLFRIHRFPCCLSTRFVFTTKPVIQFQRLVERTDIRSRTYERRFSPKLLGFSRMLSYI